MLGGGHNQTTIAIAIITLVLALPVYPFYLPGIVFLGPPGYLGAILVVLAWCVFWGLGAATLASFVEVARRHRFEAKFALRAFVIAGLVQLAVTVLLLTLGAA